MQSTMMNVPLTTAAILRHGSSVHGSATVRTLQPDGSVKVASFAEIGRRSAQLANALRGCGITGDERVATFMWNNQEHVEAYCAVPSMGAVLHTLNLRLASDQLVYIGNHAEDRVVILDGSLVPLLAPVLPHITSVHTVVVTGGGGPHPAAP
ncbi:putative fatty-acid--CoA ligase [Gordonia malaquae NBRC 108250]|uniref:Putative fatty-acid--CoA ligase n=1 Tax=Gordonia malaquae NBRC 108250 TaxID=1223542 RepID=M3TK79_GORML|nr:putative fatty-acid--CoA ligase [Gordonia malaquae NBRC 108250]